MRFVGITSIILLLSLFLCSRFGNFPINQLLLNLLALFSLSVAAFRLGQITYSKRVGYASFAATFLFPACWVFVFYPSYDLIYASLSLWALSFCWRCFSKEGAKIESFVGAGTLFACLLFFRPEFVILAIPLLFAANLQSTPPFAKTLLPLFFFAITFCGVFVLSSLAPLSPARPLPPLNGEMALLCKTSVILLCLLTLYYAVKTYHVRFIHKNDPFFAMAILCLLLPYLLLQIPALMLSSLPLLLIFSCRSYFLRLSKCIRP